MLKRTPLFDAHLAARARMVDFGGWEMPVNYGSQIEEHRAVRERVGMFDVSHMRAVECVGPGAQAFLQRLIANDVVKLATPGKALYSCMLNAEGGIIDDLIVYWLGDDRYRIVVNASTADGDVAWMREVAAEQNFIVTLTPRPDLAMIAVQGPMARDAVWQAMPGSREVTESLKPFVAATWQHAFIARTGYTGEDGFEITVPAEYARALWDALLTAGVQPAGLGARDTLRLEAGMALYGNDLSTAVTPLESGLAWTVDLRAPRDFIGRPALAAAPTRQMVGLLLEGKGVLRAHQKVLTDKGEGEITSGTFSPTLQRSIALARVPTGVAVGDTVQADVRGQPQACRVVKYPFVRHGKALIEI